MEGVPRLSVWIRLPLLLVGFLAVDVLAQLAVRAGSGNPVVALPIGVAAAGLAVWPIYVRTIGYLERRRVTELDRSQSPRLGIGVLAGVGLFAVTIAVIAALGGYRIAGWGSVSGAVTFVGVMAVAAVCEELLFRGVLFRLLYESVGVPVALTVSAVVFDGLHLYGIGSRP